MLLTTYLNSLFTSFILMFYCFMFSLSSIFLSFMLVCYGAKFLPRYKKCKMQFKFVTGFYSFYVFHMSKKQMMINVHALCLYL